MRREGSLPRPLPDRRRQQPAADRAVLAPPEAARPGGGCPAVHVSAALLHPVPPGISSRKAPAPDRLVRAASCRPVAGEPLRPGRDSQTGLSALVSVLDLQFRAMGTRHADADRGALGQAAEPAAAA